MLNGTSSPLVTEQRFVVLSMAEKTHTYDSPMSVRDHVFDFCFAVIDCDVSVCVCLLPVLAPDSRSNRVYTNIVPAAWTPLVPPAKASSTAVWL